MAGKYRIFEGYHLDVCVDSHSFRLSKVRTELHIIALVDQSDANDLDGHQRAAVSRVVHLIPL